MCRSFLWRIEAAAISSLLLLLAPFLASAQNSSEYQVKAAFIFHFTQMVEWPPDVFASNNSPLVICTFDDEIHAALVNMVIEGRTVGNHPIQTRHIRGKSTMQGCRVLVILGDDKKFSAAVLATLKNTPVLTVGDGKDFLSAGGMMGFIIQENKIRFDINLSAAQRARLKISSRLLLLARRVIANDAELSSESTGARP